MIKIFRRSLLYSKLQISSHGTFGQDTSQGKWTVQNAQIYTS